MPEEKYVLEEQMQRIPQRKNDIVEHNLILVHPTHNIHHDIAFGLVKHDPVVVQDYVCGLLGGLLEEALLECFLGF